VLLHRTARNWQAVQKAYNFLLRTVLSSVCKMWVCQSFLFCWFDVDMQIAHRHTHSHTRYVAVRSCKLGKQECETLLPCCNKFFIFKPQVPYKNQIITGMVTFVAVDDCAMGALGYSSVLQICRGGGGGASIRGGPISQHTQGQISKETGSKKLPALPGIISVEHNCATEISLNLACIRHFVTLTC